MADFHIFTGDEVIATDLPNLLNTNFSSLKNCFSGTTAPTTNLTVGQFFFNTSIKVLYQLTEIKSSGEVVWTSLGYIATKEEAEAGRDNTKQMTPLRTYEAIQKLAPLMTGATSTADGKQGIVPQPLKGEENFVLHGDGEWRVVKDFDGVLSIEKGGTGATTKSAAQTALGLNDAIVGLSVSGKTITYTQADGGTGTITTQDTTYESMTASEATTGTATTARSITAKVLNDKIKGTVFNSSNHLVFPNGSEFWIG